MKRTMGTIVFALLFAALFGTSARADQRELTVEIMGKFPATGSGSTFGMSTKVAIGPTGIVNLTVGGKTFSSQLNGGPQITTYPLVFRCVEGGPIVKTITVSVPLTATAQGQNYELQFAINWQTSFQCGTEPPSEVRQNNTGVLNFAITNRDCRFSYSHVENRDGVVAAAANNIRITNQACKVTYSATPSAQVPQPQAAGGQPSGQRSQPNADACTHVEASITKAKQARATLQENRSSRDQTVRNEMCMLFIRTQGDLTNVSGAHCPQRAEELRSQIEAFRGNRECFTPPAGIGTRG